MSTHIIFSALLAVAFFCSSAVAQTPPSASSTPAHASAQTPAAAPTQDPAHAAPAAVEAPRPGTAPAPTSTQPAAASATEPAVAATTPAASGDATPAIPEPGQPAPAGEHAALAAGAAPAHAAEAQHGEAAHGEEHAESPWGLIARLVNFIILVGALVYFLRGPLGSYLTSRSEQIRNELVTAKNTTATATAQLAEIDQKLKALPGEIETLKKRGAEEIVAEEARIKKTAEAERNRLLEQTRREIDLQVRLAKRDLTDYAATLAVDLATDRIKQTVTDTDQQRLIDRYTTQVRSAHE